MPDPDPSFALALALAEAAQRRLRKRRRRTAPRVRPAADPPRLSPTQRRGCDYEDEALALLQSRGLVPLARNLRTRAGEIDLALRDGPALVLVEVRSRAGGRYGGAAASIDRAKQARLARAAALLLPRLAALHWAGRPPPVRFDAVLFEGGRAQWLKNAFEADDARA
ncbi:YraN family protein [Bordetella sp. 2513F-2]